LILLSPIVIGIFFGLFWLTGLFISDVMARIIGLVVILMLFQDDVSGSSLVRTFWDSIPTMYVGFCIIMALGLWGAAAYIVVLSVIWTPRNALMEIND